MAEHHDETPPLRRRRVRASPARRRWSSACSSSAGPASAGLRLPFPRSSGAVPGATAAVDGAGPGEGLDGPSGPGRPAASGPTPSGSSSSTPTGRACSLDGAASLAEQAVGIAPAVGAADPGGGVLVLGPASAGATTTATRVAARARRPRDHAGSAPRHRPRGPRRRRGARRGAWPAPPRPSTRSRRAAASRCASPSWSRPPRRRGTYHGHLLATGLPEVVLAVRLEVVA